MKRMINQTFDEKKALVEQATKRHTLELEEFKKIADEFKIANDPPVYTVMDAYIFTDYTKQDVYTLIMYLWVTLNDREWVFERMKQEMSMTMPYRLKNLKEFVEYTIDMYEFLREVESEETTSKRCNIITSMKKIFTSFL